jgi:hypothetical protein
MGLGSFLKSVGSAIGIPGVGPSPGQPVSDAQKRDFALSDALARERSRAPTGQINQQYINQARGLQTQNIQQLQDAAAGKVPSAAEIAGQNMANRQAANQFGLAAAMQGGHSAGSALRQAQMGAAGVGAQAREDMMANRAAEQAQARQQLTGAITGFRGSEQDLGENQAALNQQNRNALLSAQTQMAGYGTQGAAAAADANAKEQAAKGQFFGGLAQNLGSGLALLSDERAKTDVEHAHLDSLAKALEGFTYRYKDANAPGAQAGERVGVMAQDALRGGPVGRRMVVRDPAGSLRLDGDNALGAALAMSAEALRRTRNPHGAP